MCGGKSSSMVIASSVVAVLPLALLPGRELSPPSAKLLDKAPVLAVAVAVALRVTRRVADTGGGISLLDAPVCVAGEELPRPGSVFSPSNDRTAPKPDGPVKTPRPPRPLTSPPVLTLPLRGGAGPFPASGGGTMAPGVCMPVGISGVCSPPGGINPPKDAEAGVVNESAPVPFPCAPGIGDAPNVLFRGVAAPNMLELPSGVAADMGVPGMAFSSPGVDPVAPTSIDMFVWLLLGTRAVKGIAWLLPTL